MKNIKFRAWDKTFKRWHYWELKQAFSTNNWKDLEVMQFTGLKDKNGKEIYEGDIVAYNGFGGSREKPCSKVMKWDKTGWKPSNSFEDYEKGILSYEVIGNIWENKE